MSCKMRLSLISNEQFWFLWYMPAVNRPVSTTCPHMLKSRLLLSPHSSQRADDSIDCSVLDDMEMSSAASPPGGTNPSDISFLSKVDKWSWAAFIAPSDNMLQKSSGFASLDYDTIYNDGELHYLDKRKLGRSVWEFTGTAFIRWFIFVFIGVITGALGHVMEVSISYMHRWRNLAFDMCLPAHPLQFISNVSCSDSSNDSGVFYAKLMLWNLMLAAVGCLLVVVVEPAAAGSGIDHVLLYCPSPYLCLILSTGHYIPQRHSRPQPLPLQVCPTLPPPHPFVS